MSDSDEVDLLDSYGDHVAEIDELLSVLVEDRDPDAAAVARLAVARLAALVDLGNNCCGCSWAEDLADRMKDAAQIPK